MAIQNRPSNIDLSKRFFSVILFLCFSSAFTFSQGKPSFNDSKYLNEWWFPLIKKHNIDSKQFTSWGNIKPESSNPTGYTALELGKGAYVNDTSLFFKDPVFFIKENDEVYTLITAKSASHALRCSQIIWENGKVESYKFRAGEFKPTESMSFNELRMDTKTKKTFIKNIRGGVNN